MNNQIKINDKVYIVDENSIYYKEWGYVDFVIEEFYYISIAGDKNCAIEFFKFQLKK